MSILDWAEQECRIACKRENPDFFFDKRQYTRQEVVNKLGEYFKDKVIIGGCCRVDSITLLWTLVQIRDFNK